MKNNQLLFAFFTLCFSSVVFSQATASFSASVTVIQPVGITTTSNLKFSKIDAKNGGEVTLTPNSTRTTSGGIVLAEGGVASAASFEISGEPGYTYDISLPNETYELSNGDETILINNFTSDFNSETALATGSQIINVGATIKLNPNQTPGNYVNHSGFNVDVNYN